jgi:ABC-type spermidine/putrescine transport system permease subunit I
VARPYLKDLPIPAESWAVLWTVVVPNLRGPLTALCMLLFITAWNEYFWPAMVLRGTTSVIQLGLQGFLSPEGVDWSALTTAAGLCLILRWRQSGHVVSGRSAIMGAADRARNYRQIGH